MFKSIRNLVWVDDDSTKPQQSLIQTPQPIMSPTLGVDVQVSTTGGLDTATLETMLLDRIKNNEAFALANDFFKVNESLITIIADEPTRFKAAAAASKSDPNLLIASVNSFEATLTLESENFNSAFIGAAENEIAILEKRINTSAAEIQRLTEELGRVSAEKNAHDSELITKKSDLAKSRIDFASVSEKIRYHYTGLVSKLSKLTTV